MSYVNARPVNLLRYASMQLMHEFQIVPAKRIGPVQLGMTRSASRAAFESLTEAVDSLCPSRECDNYFDNAFQVFFTQNDHVDWIQVCPSLSFRSVLLNDDVTTTPADVLVRNLCCRVGQDMKFDARANYSFPSLQLFLWDADEQYDLYGQNRLIYGAIGIDSRRHAEGGPLVATY